MNLPALIHQLNTDESIRLKPYLDTKGKLTIGCGRNLDDVGISQSESDLLLSNDIDRAVQSLNRYLPWWTQLDDDRQNVLANMCFNMGIARLLEFHRFLSALEVNDYTTASVEMMDSVWAHQVGERAVRLSTIISGQPTPNT